MPFTDDQYSEAQSWVVWLTDDDRTQADDDYDRLGSKWAVIIERLRRRLSELIHDPASVNLGGEYSQNTAANITALERLILKAETAAATEANAATGGVPIGRLVRHDPVRDTPRRLRR